MALHQLYAAVFFVELRSVCIDVYSACGYQHDCKSSRSRVLDDVVGITSSSCVVCSFCTLRSCKWVTATATGKPCFLVMMLVDSMSATFEMAQQ
jgi:hypothetical protein